MTNNSHVTWPTHGHAKNARDDSAERAQLIRKKAYELSKKVKENASESEILFDLIDISVWASDILRLLEGQGAPTFPDPPSLLH